MAKIPFDIKFRPQIESGEYKVETRDGKPVRIICWDREDSKYPIIFLTKRYDLGECCFSCTNSGSANISRKSQIDLFLITPEPELSEFEEALEVFLMNADSSEETFHEEVKKHAAELLELVRKEMEEELKEKVLHDYWKQVSDQRIQARKEGKSEALKDLPRWRKEQGEIELAAYGFIGGGVASQENPRVYLNGYSIDLYSLEKLPKEDEK